MLLSVCVKTPESELQNSEVPKFRSSQAPGGQVPKFPELQFPGISNYLIC